MANPISAVHFVGFTDSKQYWLACQVWGPPDFIHRQWDARAAWGGERGADDVFVFARGTIDDPPREWSFDDSAVM